MKCEIMKLYVGPGGAILGGNFPERLLEKAIAWVEEQGNKENPIIAKDGIIVPAKWIGSTLEPVKNPIVKCSAYRGFVNKTYLVKETVMNAGNFVIISNGKYKAYLFDGFAVESGNGNEFETIEKIQTIRERFGIRRGAGVLSRNNFAVMKIEGDKARVYNGTVLKKKGGYVVKHEEKGPITIEEAIRLVPWHE